MKLFRTIVSLLLIASPAAVPASPRPVTTAEIHESVSADIDKDETFLLHGTVTAPGFPSEVFILTDKTGPIAALLPQNLHWETGDVVDAEVTVSPWEAGTKALGYNFKRVRVKRSTTTGHVQIPPPAYAKPIEILQGAKDLQSVRLKGIVTDAFRDEIDRKYNWIYLSDGGSRIAITFADEQISQQRLDQLIDSAVEVTGICFPYADGYRRFLKPHLRIGAFDDIRILSAAPSNPYGGAELDRLFAKSPPDSSALDHRCHTAGRIVVTWRDQNALIESDVGTRIHVRMRKRSALPAVGSRIRAAGFLRKNTFFATLGDAIYQLEGISPAPLDKPKFIGTKDILLDGYGINPRPYGQIVRLSGTVKSLTFPKTANGCMTVESDGHTFPVELGELDPPEINSRVEITGACMLTTEPDDGGSGFGRLGDFSVIPRSNDDIVVLADPPGLIPKRVIIVLAVLLAAIVIILIWNMTLRSRVERRSRELATEQVARSESDLKVKERTRLAVELHDSIAQNLTGVSMEIDTAGQLSEGAQPQMLRHLNLASKSLESCRIELRNCIWDLRSNALEETDLNDAVEIAVRPHLGDAKLSVRFNVQRQRLPDNLVHALIRIIRELVTNAIRHGGADLVRVSGSLENDRLSFAVSDNGRGFDPESCPGVTEGHFGLQGIRERIDPFNGEMLINHRAKRGMRIMISLTLPPRDSKA